MPEAYETVDSFLAGHPAVAKAFEDHPKNELPLILCGETDVGKTVPMKDLLEQYRKQHIPVLVIDPNREFELLFHSLALNVTTESPDFLVKEEIKNAEKHGIVSQQ